MMMPMMTMKKITMTIVMFEMISAIDHVQMPAIHDGNDDLGNTSRKKKIFGIFSYHNDTMMTMMTKHNDDDDGGDDDDDGDDVDYHSDRSCAGAGYSCTASGFGRS